MIEKEDEKRRGNACESEKEVKKENGMHAVSACILVCFVLQRIKNRARPSCSLVKFALELCETGEERFYGCFF